MDFLNYSFYLWDLLKEKDSKIADMNYVFLDPCTHSDTSKMDMHSGKMLVH